MAKGKMGFEGGKYSAKSGDLSKAQLKRAGATKAAAKRTVDIGKTRTGFSIVSRGIILFTSTIKSIGGENLTKSIQNALGVSHEEAEQLKIKNGLLYSTSNKEVFEINRVELNSFDKKTSFCSSDLDSSICIISIVLSNTLYTLLGSHF